MPIVLIDYTSFSCTTVARAAIPAVLSGKFVQIRNEDSNFLVLSPKELTKYHANIVERFCMDRGIEGNYDAKGERFLIQDQVWQVLGGGKFDWNRGARTIRLYGDSMAYGKIRPEGLKEALAALTQFAGYTITIE